MRFAAPIFLILFLILPWLLWRYFKVSGSTGGKLLFSDIGRLKKIRKSKSLRLRHSLVFLRVLALGTFILALARPQAALELTPVYTEGIDIVLALDVSTSMRAEDLKKGANRLDVAKEVVVDFLKGRKNDRIGMVVFAANAYTQCPLTVDYGILRKFMERVKTGIIEDGTALGNAIANSINRLKNSQAKSKVIILLTDGVNNRGEIDPITAAKIAKSLKIKIYTIGAGTTGKAPVPVSSGIFGQRYVMQQVEIDEEVLTNIADQTGGEYFRAKDAEALKSIFSEIDSLERTEVKSEGNKRFEELFGFFLLAGLAFLFLEIILVNTRFRRLP